VIGWFGTWRACCAADAGRIVTRGGSPTGLDGVRRLDEAISFR
jgi:hypothetical protein